MGGLLAVPTFFVSAVTTLSERGLKYSICYAITYIYLTISRRLRKRRFDLYDFSAIGQPQKNSVLIPREEWSLDTPRSNANLTQNNDDLFCWGVNRQSDAVVAHISRQSGGKVLCSLLLRLADGRVFTLPEEHRIQSETSELNTFGSARFKLQCMSPMRRWRLFFNGILRVHKSGETSHSNVFEHVKFTFIWTVSSEVFDFTSDISTQSLSNLVASSGSFSPKSLLKRLTKVLNCYEQPGMLLGTVNVAKEDEREIYLWGIRGRYLGETKDLNMGNFEQIYVSYTNGAQMHVGFLNLPEISKKFMYGYFMRSDGFICPILEFTEEMTDSSSEQIRYKLFTSGRSHTLIRDKCKNDQSEFHKEYSGKSYVQGVTMKLEEFDGKGFVFNGSICNDSKKNSVSEKHSVPLKQDSITQALCLPFQNVQCQESDLTGGKGSSLGKLYAMSTNNAEKQSSVPQFTVPNGMVVTTKAYQEFTKGSLQNILDQFEKNIWSCPEENIPILCKKMVEDVQNAHLPKSVILAVISSLHHEFNDKLSESKFAVRSSATGEDTDQMSAAGQMETFLGLKGTEQILDAVIKCWASQFAFQAVEYKRRYGQRLNTPMAVVIQEMIPCEVAGVCFTCDPVTGNPAFVSITANFGLGESVVSASAEPDTVVLERHIDNSLVFHSQHLGNKKMKIVMDASSGTKEIEVEGDQSSQCCLDDEMALALGNIAVAIEIHYGSSRDIEWGIIGKKIFLFQARPVTSLDLETDFETKHWYDTFLRCDHEWLSKANVGEVMPAAHSPLGLDVNARNFELAFLRQKTVRWDGCKIPSVPYYAKKIIYAFNNVFFSMLDGFFVFTEDDFSKAMIVAVYGREIDTTELQKIFLERHQTYKKNSQSSLELNFFTVLAMFMSGKWIRTDIKKLENFVIPRDENFTASEMFEIFVRHFDIPVVVLNSHMQSSIASSSWNLSMLMLLAKAKGGFNNNIYSDFAYLLSTCSDVESADVPAAIQNLGATISKCTNVEEFKNMSGDEALNWLRTTKTEASEAFQNFFLKHGHRCLKEFDVYTDTWQENPMSLVKMLQSFVMENMEESHKKVMPTFNNIVAKLQTKLNFWQRLKLRWILPYSQSAVRNREFSKSWLIRMLNERRKPLKTLSKIMVKEGRLPKKELLFFLTIDEIEQLIKTRSPRLVAKAFHRWRCHSEIDKLIFPELMSGIPKPSNSDEFIIEGDGMSMTGIPVSQGVVKATARVIVSINEAPTIQRGDILITYSTDIAWSPYFPLLSGVVTELGGLISHGAVVAREYGLPCVVGLHGATNVFKSGEMVVLDGNKGTLTKVE